MKTPITEMVGGEEKGSFRYLDRRKWLVVLTGCQLQVTARVRQHTDKVADGTLLLEDMPPDVHVSLISHQFTSLGQKANSKSVRS